MANVIQIKRKTTTGAPALAQLAVGEGCLVSPDDTRYFKKDASTLLSWPSGAGAGDMLASIYYPSGVSGNAFSRSNHTGMQTASTISDFQTAVSGNSDVTANTAKVSYDTADVDSRISTAIDALIGGAPGALNTLNELAAAIADDAAFSATVTASIAAKLDADSTIDGGTIS